ncbi:carbonic anhydrase 2-like [Eriocheir sinensis]|uniref:carbonic anhydrase 2-like n=1 Tax=Eriocheir sinensis TaxID=95602 RepID=UPI0021C82031|nr:carbonic anhydrase 2-like [Eriocheir sinensis]
MKTLLILVAVLEATATVTEPGWIYGPERIETDRGYGDHNGPDTWPDMHPMCGGSKQSPVALDTRQALLNTSRAPFEFTGYNSLPPFMEVTNTGHAVEINSTIQASVSGGNLPGKYIFSQVHFHFGSEHTVNGNRFPAEVHLVHYLERYGNFSEALKHDNGVAVLSVMLELSSEDNPLLDPIVNALTKITKPGESASITPFPLSCILPKNTDRFFRYDGSLTTPECNEVVVWTVFLETVPISTAQLEEFRKLMGAHGEPLADNFRPTQELNGRQVYVHVPRAMPAARPVTRIYPDISHKQSTVNPLSLLHFYQSGRQISTSSAFPLKFALNLSQRPYPIRSYPIRSYPIRSYPIRPYPIRPYPIQPYSIQPFPSYKKKWRLLRR